MTATGGTAYSVGYAYNKNNWLLIEIKQAGNVTDITDYQYDRNGNQYSKNKQTLAPIGTATALQMYILGANPGSAVAIYEYSVDRDMPFS